MTKFILTTLLLILALAGSASALVSATSGSAIREVALATAYWPIVVGPSDTLYAYTGGSVYRSTNYGATWTEVFSSEGAWTGCLGLYVTASGRVCVGVTNTGTMPVLAYDGGAADQMQVTATLTFDCAATTPKAAMWHMGQDAAGYLYAGEYGGNNTGDTCAVIWKSVNDGETWTKVYDDPTGRHIHSVRCGNSAIYASQGDAASPKILKSVNAGASWTTIRDGTWAQPIDFLFPTGWRVIGSDRGSTTMTNGIERTSDDAAWTLEASFESTQNAFGWSLARDGDFLVCGTVAKSTDTTGVNRVGLYGSWNKGDDWWLLKNVGTSGNQMVGVDGITWTATSKGHMFYHENIGTASTTRIQRKRDWTIGTGQDYATLALALADTLNVGAGDTLTIIPGKYGITNLTPRTNMTWRSSTAVAADVTLTNSSATVSSIVLTKAGFVLKNVTLRTPTDYHAGNKAFLECTTAAVSATFTNVEFRNCDADALGYEGAILWNVAGALSGALAFQSCLFDSCNSVADARYGIGYIKNVGDLTFDDCIIKNCYGRHAAFFLGCDSGSTATGHIYDSLFYNCDGDGVGATYHGAALRLAHNVAAVNFGGFTIRRCTFDDCDAANTVTGVISFSGGNAGAIGETYLDHLIITNSTCAPTAAGVAGTNQRTDTWSNNASLEYIRAASKTDTLHVDPLYKASIPVWYGFEPQSAVANGGSSCISTDDGSYMGWTGPTGGQNRRPRR